MKRFFSHKQIGESVWVIRCYPGDTEMEMGPKGSVVLVYLIEGSEKALLFDTGLGLDDLKTYVHSITKLPVIAVNSHGHVDHIAGNDQFNHVWLHESDFAMFMIHNQYEPKRRFMSQMGAKLLFEGNRHTLVPMKDDTVFDLGSRMLHVVPLPGHTPGSVGLWDEQSRILFTGDAISPFMLFASPNGMPSPSISVWLKHVKGLLELNIDRIAPAHVDKHLDKAFLIRLINFIENLDRKPSIPMVNNSPEYFHGELRTVLGNPDPMADDFFSVSFEKTVIDELIASKQQ